MSESSPTSRHRRVWLVTAGALTVTMISTAVFLVARGGDNSEATEINPSDQSITESSTSDTSDRTEPTDGVDNSDDDNTSGSADLTPDGSVGFDINCVPETCEVSNSSN